MKWLSPQCVAALGSLFLGFLLVYLAWFFNEGHIIGEGPLWVLGQSFIFCGMVFGVKGYVDGKFSSWQDSIGKRIGK